MSIRKFGVEIRHIGNVSHLYEDVDSILSNYGIQRGSVNATVQAKAVAHSLHKMIQTSSFFCVITIQNCADVCQVLISKERMDIYRTQHCIHWNEMTDDFRMMITAMVLDDFRHILNPQ